MAVSERCKGCEGPVELVTIPMDEGGFRALPDTLEEINQARVTLYCRTHTEYEQDIVDERDLLVRVVQRLFQGCAECGRKPQIIRAHMKFADEAVNVGKRQAFQQAAEMVIKAVDSCVEDFEVLGKLATDLRKLAEDT
jgi:hypothetical protein